MKMSRMEKLLVNRERKGIRNAEAVGSMLKNVDGSRIRDGLELGCGLGVVSATLARHYHVAMVATDIDPQEIDLARRFFGESPRLRIKVEDPTHLTFPNRCFDLVVSQMLFHHIPVWEQAVSEIARVLRPHGVLIWQDVALSESLKNVLSPASKSYGLFTMEDVFRACGASGLEPCVHERRRHGPFLHHYLMLQRGDPVHDRLD